jgi:hypothetical protein
LRANPPKLQILGGRIRVPRSGFSVAIVVNVVAAAVVVVVPIV